MRSSRFKLLRLVFILVLIAAAMASCGSDDEPSADSDDSDQAATDDSSSDDTADDSSDDTDATDSEDSEDAGSTGDPLDSTGFIGERTSGDPVEGGTLTFSPYAPVRSLDPATQTDSGVGNAELSSLYDALMRYDYDTNEYTPWQAESLEPNDDFSVWTLTLREGIMFTDGTPLNAEAVALQMTRTTELRPGTYADGIVAEATDDLTVVYTLPSPWVGFPYALSVNPGRIPSPTALEALGEDFATQPVGAGPFVLESWTPGEEMVLVRNDDYWGEGPYLDELRFVALRGDQARLDSILSDEVDAGFLRSPEVVSQAVADGLNGFNNVLTTGEALVINNGVNSDDVPGHDVRIRQAIALAIDPDTLNDVVSNGAGIWSKRLFPESSSVSGSVDAVAYDPEQAAVLVEEAKADGFDGKIVLTCDAAPEREREGLALQAQLNAVGFDVELDSVPSVVDTIRKFLQEGSFELACYGFSFQDNAPYVGPVQTMTTGEGNKMGYEDPNMNGLLEDLRLAAPGQETIDAIDALQTLVNETQPFVPLASVRELIAWDPRVHGINISSFSVPMFNEAWIAE